MNSFGVVLILLAVTAYSQTTLPLSRTAGADPGPGIPACSEDKGWFSLFDGTSESVVKYWFNPSGQNHGSNSRWWITNNVLYSDQSADRTGGCIFTKKQYKNVEFKTLTKPYFGNDAGIFLRSNSAGRSYQVVIDFVAGSTKAIGGIWGEARSSGQDINYKPFGFNSATSITLRSEWYSNGQNGRPLLTAADWNGKIWKDRDFNWVGAKIYNGDVPFIDTWINEDYQMVHYEDPASKARNEVQNGHIALQVHTGSGNWSINNPNQYKAMLVREVNADGTPLAAYPEWDQACASSAAPGERAAAKKPTLRWKLVEGNAIRLEGESPQPYTLTVSDMNGKVVHHRQGGTGSYSHVVSAPEAGISLVSIHVGTYSHSYRIFQAAR
jgi:hypothetical protein